MLGALIFGGLYLFQRPDSPASAPPPAPTPTATVEGPGFWQKMTGILEQKTAVTPSNGDAAQEIAGLREENAKLAAKIEARESLVDGKPGLVQFFGPASVPVAAEESWVEIRNPKVGRDELKQVTLDFEVQNTDVQQRQVRGYILVLAKTADSVVAYPAAAFSPSDNVLVNYAKGETFAVSRVRPSHATFAAAALEGKKTSFQIVLFRTDGRVFTSQHVEGKP